MFASIKSFSLTMPLVLRQIRACTEDPALPAHELTGNIYICVS